LPAAAGTSPQMGEKSAMALGGTAGELRLLEIRLLHHPPPPSESAHKGQGGEARTAEMGVRWRTGPAPGLGPPAAVVVWPKPVAAAAVPILSAQQNTFR
jgi:hypothetical protein